MTLPPQDNGGGANEVGAGMGNTMNNTTQKKNGRVGLAQHIESGYSTIILTVFQCMCMCVCVWRVGTNSGMDVTFTLI